MKSFYVINEDFNARKMKPYDIMPYLIETYQKEKKKPTTREEFKKFITNESMYMWWSRSQYEIILTNWPGQSYTEKWDIHDQIMMNLEVITDLLIENVGYN